MQLVGAEEQLAAEYQSTDERPWFGAMSLFTGAKRGGTARCVQKRTVLLLVEPVNFNALLEVVPDFKLVLETSSSAFAALNEMKRKEQQEKLFAQEQRERDQRLVLVNEILAGSAARKVNLLPRLHV